jgi:long-subunit fatty acid transport protein
MMGWNTGRHYEATGHIYATFRYECAKKFTFSVGQASDYKNLVQTTHDF